MKEKALGRYIILIGIAGSWNDSTFRSKFCEIVSEYEKKLDYAAKHTNLPDEPDLNKMQEYVF